MSKVKFSELTQYQIEVICNGCGGKGSLIQPPYAIFFETSCNHHDYKYWVGGTEDDRKYADKELLKMMLKDCQRLSWFKRVRYKPWCYLYYTAVRCGGSKYFHYGKKRWPAATSVHLM